MVNTVVACAEFFLDKPKWRSWQQKEEAEEEEKNKRPIGNKKAKQIAKDCELVEKLITTEDKKKQESVEKNQESRNNIMKTVGDSVGKVGCTLDVIAATVTASMQEQNELKFIEMLSPNSKKRFLNAKLELKLAEMKQKKRDLGTEFVATPKRKKTH